MGLATAFTAIGGLVGAVGNAKAANYQAAQSERAAQIGRIQADQTDAAYRDELNSTVSNIRAIRSSAGVQSGSPTENAYIGTQIRKSDRDRTIDVGNKRMQATQDEMDAKFRRRSAKISLLGGAASTLGTAFGKSGSGFFGQ